MHTLLKGIVLLIGVIGGAFLIGADSLMTILNGTDVKPIPVKSSSHLNRNNENVVEGILFGSDQSTEKPITETSLRFILKGTVPSSSKENSFAIIQLADRKERVISIGEELIDRVVLLEVLSDYVVLLRDGKREKLSFPIVNRIGLIASEATRVEPPKNPAPRGAQSNSPDSINNGTSSTAGKVAESIARPLQDVAQSAALKTSDTDLNSDQEVTFGQAGVSVNRAGIKVSANSMFIGFGLKQGDTVLSINGIPSKEFVNNSLAIAEARESGDASVLVRRGSDTVTLNIKF